MAAWKLDDAEWDALDELRLPHDQDGAAVACRAQGRTRNLLAAAILAEAMALSHREVSK